MPANNEPDLNSLNHSDFYHKYANPVPASKKTPLPDGINQPVQPTGVHLHDTAGDVKDAKKLPVPKTKKNVARGADGIPNPMHLQDPPTGGITG